MSERMVALREGELVLVNGCIRLDGAVLIWPYGFRLEVEGEVVRVWDDADRLVGMVGEPMTVGGGEYTLGGGYERHIEKLIGEPLSDNCPGPFWLVGDTNELKPTPYFPQLASPMSERMTAEREGELVLVDGCIRLEGAVLIWPYGFRLEVEGEAVRVWDDADRLVGMVGEPIYVGGGEYALGYGYERHIEKLIGEPLSDNCPGPFWLVGDVDELVIG